MIHRMTFLIRWVLVLAAVLSCVTSQPGKESDAPTNRDGTMAPTKNEPCYVCGKADEEVEDPKQKVDFNGNQTDCGIIELGGLNGMIPKDGCKVLQDLGCKCVKIADVKGSDPPSAAPGNGGGNLQSDVPTPLASDAATPDDGAPPTDEKDVPSASPMMMPVMAPTPKGGPPMMMAPAMSPTKVEPPTKPVSRAIDPPTASSSSSTVMASLLMIVIVSSTAAMTLC